MTTLTHPTRGDAEFTLTVYCDSSHEQRTIDILGYWPPPAGVVGFLSWLTAGDSLQTPFGEKAAAERRAGFTGHIDLGGRKGTPRGFDYATRWRFQCPECDATTPVRGERMEQVLENLRRLGVSDLSLSDLTSNL